MSTRDPRAVQIVAVLQQQFRMADVRMDRVLNANLVGCLVVSGTTTERLQLSRVLDLLNRANRLAIDDVWIEPQLVGGRPVSLLGVQLKPGSAY